MEEQIYYTEEYDEELKKIPFLELHESYLPFIGKDYSKQSKKILIVGESHYVSTDWKWGEAEFEKWWGNDWYNQLFPDYYKTHTDEEFTDWFNTRLHANRAASDNKKEKAIKQVIQNPLKILAEEVFKEAYKKTSITKIAFMNFFQFPSLIYGKSIGDSIKERTKYIKNRKEKREKCGKIWDKLFDESLKVLKEVINIIKPDLVIICSTLAGNSVCCEQNNEFVTNANIFYTTHSTFSAWKNGQKRFNGQTGEEHFTQIVKEYMSKNSEKK